jgi:hypothetical protein
MVDEYIDDFCKMIDRARYFEGAHIVLKFHQGLNVMIQDHVACMTAGRPSDDAPQEWYTAALLCNKNHIANEAFRASSWRTPTLKMSSTTGNMF